jgi:hypothetical protein
VPVAGRVDVRMALARQTKQREKRVVERLDAPNGRFMRRIIIAAVLIVAMSQSASAWGLNGHLLISQAAAEQLPDTLPAFVRSPDAVREIAALGPELDVSKNSGATHDQDLDPGHYVDLTDDELVEGAVDLSALPVSRQLYDTALREKGSNEYKAGYLPYALIDGWQQIVKDFAIWRIDRVGETKAATQAERTWFAGNRALREILTLRDIGVWSHYVGDGSQPLHTTVHFNGWGKYPNPKGYSTKTDVHAKFESDFVNAHATIADVRAHMRPYKACGCTIQQEVVTYLKASRSQVVPLYEIDLRGGFANASPEAVEFMRARLGDGATMLRDMIVDAYGASSTLKVGYPKSMTPADAEAGTVIPSMSLNGG